MVVEPQKLPLALPVSLDSGDAQAQSRPMMADWSKFPRRWQHAGRVYSRFGIVWSRLRTASTTRLLSLVMLLILTLPTLVQAQFAYTTNNGTITITGYTGPGGAVTIPSTINDLPVTSIGDRAFQSHSTLTSITIPNSITNIGSWAFYFCTKLTGVMIPNSVTSIGYEAFDFCSSLTILTIGNNVRSIGDFAFSGCFALTNITIPDSVTSIGQQAFNSCTSLTNISIGNGVASIGKGAFIGCSSLQTATVNALNSYYGSVAGVLFDKNQTTLILYPAGRAGPYTIPASVKSIGDSAFLKCSSLTGSITIPNSVTNIGSGAFGACISMTNVKIGNAVSSIGSLAFVSCHSLTAITVPNSVTSIGDGAFWACTNLTGITVEALNAVYTSVDGVLFNRSQTKLVQYPAGQSGTHYVISSSVTSIGNYAFGDCTSLTSVTIPDSVTNIGDWAFVSCTSLTNITIPNNVTSIGQQAFNRCGNLASVTIPMSVTNVGSSAFVYCTNLTGVYFRGDAPNSVGSSVFYNANNATVYYLPGTMGWGATFSGRPASLWKPLVQTGDGSFGVRTNQFGFNITWAGGRVIVVEACTNLANPFWTPLQTNALSDDSLYFSDPEWTKYSRRCYRLRSP